MIAEMVEDVDYELIPTEDHNDQGWDIRFLRGPYTETVIRFGNISLDEKNDCLRFNFVVVSTPNGELSEETAHLQETAAMCLESILEKAAEDGTLQTRDHDED